MATVTLNVTDVREYRNGVLQTAETARMGTNGSYYHDVVIEINLPRSLSRLQLDQDWRAHNPSSNATGYTYSAAIIEEARTEAPETADLTYHFNSSIAASLIFERALKKGKWYIWLWRHSKGTPGFVSGARADYPVLTITGETAGGTVTAFVSGEAKAATPKVWRGGEWHDPLPKAYRGGQWVDPI